MSLYILSEAVISSKKQEHSSKKIMPLLWTLVTYSLKNTEYVTDHDIDSTYGASIH